MKKKIVTGLEIILLFILFFYIFINYKTISDSIVWNFLSLKKEGIKENIFFPFVEKEFQNDTFFTIAIGRNIFKYGFTNLDRLTFHKNLYFPHSGIFDILINSIYELFDFNRSILLCCRNIINNFFKPSLYLL